MINFSLDGTFTINAVLPNLGPGNGELTVDGVGHVVSISGGNTTGIFDVDAGGTLHLANLTVTASSGSAITNSGTLTATTVNTDCVPFVNPVTVCVVPVELNATGVCGVAPTYGVTT